MAHSSIMQACFPVSFQKEIRCFCLLKDNLLTPRLRLEKGTSPIPREETSWQDWLLRLTLGGNLRVLSQKWPCKLLKCWGKGWSNSRLYISNQRSYGQEEIAFYFSLGIEKRSVKMMFYGVMFWTMKHWLNIIYHSRKCESPILSIFILI